MCDLTIHDTLEKLSSFYEGFDEATKQIYKKKPSESLLTRYVTTR